MKRVVLLALAFVAVVCAATPEFSGRRQALRKALPGTTIVLFGRAAEANAEFTSQDQESNFYYLTGWKEQGAALLIDPRREVLFLPPRNTQHDKLWGPQAAADDPDILEKTGFPTVLPIDAFDGQLHASLDRWSALYTAGTEAQSRLRTMAPEANLSDATVELARLRMKKSLREIEFLEHAAGVTAAAHLAAWKQALPGKFEYQIAAAMAAAYLDLGCEHGAYPPIVAAGPNAIYLHYTQNNRRIEPGELLLMDVGAQCVGYAADVTRTIPASGVFMPRQREIYEIVLGAQKAAIAAVRPGMSLEKTAPNSLYQVAYNYINSHGRSLKGEPLGQYFTHGIGHHVGLDVHDAAVPNTRLEEGMVITIEPGIYIPEEQIGIRIEDMVLVTRGGARVLTGALPREVAEIEKAFAK